MSNTGLLNPYTNSKPLPGTETETNELHESTGFRYR